MQVENYKCWISAKGRQLIKALPNGEFEVPIYTATRDELGELQEAIAQARADKPPTNLKGQQ